MINVKIAATLMVALMMFSGAAVMVEAGDNDATSDFGQAYGMGRSQYYNVGTGSNTDVATPTAITSMDKVSKLVAVTNSTYFLQDNKLYAVGSNYYSQFGYDTQTAVVQTITQIGSTLGDIVDFYADDSHTYIIDSNGNLYGAGKNGNNEIDPNSTSDVKTFTQIGAGLGTVSKVIMSSSPSTYSTLFIADGKLYGLGRNDHHQIDGNTTSNITTPTQIGAGLGTVTDACFTTMNVYFIAGGKLYGQGSNSYNQIDSSSTSDVTTPTQIGSSNVIKAACYTGSLAFITDTYDLYVVGVNTNAILGTGDTNTVTTPTQIGSTLGDITDVQIVAQQQSSNDYFIMEFLADGKLYGCGKNNYYQLSSSNSSSVVTPQQVGTMNNIIKFYNTGATTFVINENLELFGVGQNDHKQITDSTATKIGTFTQIGSTLGEIIDASCVKSTTFFIVAPSTVTASFAANDDNYGSVSDVSIADIEPGTVATISGNTITIGETVVTATPAVADAQYTYAFSKWQVSGVDVTGTYTLDADTTFTAVFTATTNQYAVTIAPNDPSYGSVSPTSLTVDYGTAITVDGTSLSIGAQAITATPTTADAQYTYAFSAWSVPDAAETVTSNITITGTFTATVNTYTVTIESADDTLGTVSPTTVSDVPYGTAITVDGDTITIGETTVTATTTEAGDGLVTQWSVANGATVQGDITITASFIEPSNAENSLLKLIPFLLVMVLVVTAVGGLVATGGNPESLVRFIIMLAVGVVVVAVFVLPIMEGL